MKERDFDIWLSKFRASIATYDYYIDFEKVYRNVDEIKIELNILNSLIGSKNIKEDFIKVLKKYPETLKVIPILLAKRENEIYCQDENGVIYTGLKLKNIHRIVICSMRDVAILWNKQGCLTYCRTILLTI